MTQWRQTRHRSRHWSRERQIIATKASDPLRRRDVAVEVTVFARMTSSRDGTRSTRNGTRDLPLGTVADDDCGSTIEMCGDHLPLGVDHILPVGRPLTPSPSPRPTGGPILAAVDCDSVACMSAARAPVEAHPFGRGCKSCCPGGVRQRDPPPGRPKAAGPDERDAGLTLRSHAIPH